MEQEIDKKMIEMTNCARIVKAISIEVAIVMKRDDQSQWEKYERVRGGGKGGNGKGWKYKESEFAFI